MPKSTDKIGLWMIGATGGVSSTVALGLAALAEGLTEPHGLVTTHPDLHGVELAAPENIVFGGHEIRGESLEAAVHHLHAESGLFDASIVETCAPTLGNMQRNVRPGTLVGASEAVTALDDGTEVPVDATPGDAVERIAADIEAFRTAHHLARVVVIHAASSEPPPPPMLLGVTQSAAVAKALTGSGEVQLPTSTLYALAAIKAGCGYVNFTPSLGIGLPAVVQGAEARGIAFMGNDGKTGETLVKSALAPMFAMRNLPILSWMGQNILGNRDGAVLNDPRTRQAKIHSKEKTVAALTAGAPRVGVSIDYVPSLGDWKVAWDYVHFDGFLGTKMSLQFTWQGADSVLAAPLIIDLVRLVDLEMRRGRSGLMKHLAFFFKDPMGCDDFNLFNQWRTLVAHVTRDAN